MNCTTELADQQFGRTLIRLPDTLCFGYTHRSTLVYLFGQDTILTEGIVAAPSTVTEICKDHRCPRPFTRILPLAIGDHEEYLRHDRLPELACCQQDHMATEKSDPLLVQLSHPVALQVGILAKC